MVSQYMRHARLPHSTRLKLRQFYALSYPGKRSFDESSILGEISRPLLEEITQHKCRPVLSALTLTLTLILTLIGELSRPLLEEITQHKCRPVLSALKLNLP